MPDPLPSERVPASAFFQSTAAASTKLLQHLPGRGQTPIVYLRPPEKQHVLSEDLATMRVVAQSADWACLLRAWRALLLALWLVVRRRIRGYLLSFGALQHSALIWPFSHSEVDCGI